MTIIQGIGTVPRAESGRSIHFDSKSASSYKKVEKDDFIIHLRSFEGGLEIANETGIVSPAYTILRSKKPIAPTFYYAYFHTDEFINHVLSKAVEGIRDGKQISFNVFKDLCIPHCDLSEQLKIQNFLDVLDKRITAQCQLVHFLKLYKRGLSSALFERRIRMKKSNGSSFAEWGKATLGDIFLERNERALGGEKLLAVTISNGIQDRSDLDLKDNSSEDKSNYRKVHVGDIAYNTMRMWQGACGVSAFDGIVSPAYTVIYVADKTKSEPRFWAYLFKEIRMLRLFQRNSQGLTSDTWNLKYDKFSKIAVKVPSFDEQIVIADYLDSISRLIAMNENSLVQMEVYKRSLLSQMFI